MALQNNHLIWHNHSIDRSQRERLHGHKGMVIWLTGLSGSGKSTLAGELEQVLHIKGISTSLLDGDNIRHGLCQDLGFSQNDRQENIRRVGEVAALMLEAGLVVITAFISPQRAERDSVRKRIGEQHFFEVFLDTPLEICEARDPKGLYQKARAGLIKDFTGIDADYQAPLSPQLYLDGALELSLLVEKMVNYFDNKLLLG